MSVKLILFVYMFIWIESLLDRYPCYLLLFYCRDNPTALHLRAMNMRYEGLKSNSTIVIVPGTALDTIQLGGISGMTSLSMGLSHQMGGNEKVSDQTK